MEELINQPGLWKAVVGLLFFLAMFIKANVWLRDGGLYYKKYPVAAAMDRMSRTGELSGKNVEAVLMSVDPSKPKPEQVKDFESAIEAQK